MCHLLTNKCSLCYVVISRKVVTCDVLKMGLICVEPKYVALDTLEIKVAKFNSAACVMVSANELLCEKEVANHCKNCAACM